ncbi:MAG: molybdopterin molybdotransferase MoeA [Atribacterota bacterium]|jgi:molybdopterin molybdotransferase|nr:molybdopterin molybdotransferase MoeA [Atribacterota bacterium]MDD3641462.1 molybdopterin molybdotransferase MoeA [Atribacterota bacterium]MDD4289090.1 molybdopterin molybdotransferase MoeA [Atribacterota bacterium]MDD4764476.1 molybdopterin molybdotransferase MoeA [Atribacterota bacterium]
MFQPLFKVITIEESIKIFRESFDFDTFFQNRKQKIELNQAFTRVLAEDIVSRENIPGFNRSTMDGYAVKASDTFGASDSLPAYLDLIGEIKMSEKPSCVLKNGQAVRISTGGMLPEGANSVVMLEYTENISSSMIEISRSVAPWENVLREDEDIKSNEKVLEKGYCLRPQDIGLLAALGWESINVFKKPKIAIISTGDEIVPINQKPEPGQVRNINTFMLGAAINQLGCIPHYAGIVKDNEKVLTNELQSFKENPEIDLVLISGGSSVGVRDYTLKVLDSLGSPGVLVHGLALKPGKPTIISLNDGKLFIGLPGHPVSAMMVFENVVKKIIYELKGEIFHFEYEKTIDALLDSNVFSDAGREEYVRVVLKNRHGQLWAIPVLGKSGMISSLAAADGYITIRLNQEGLYQGEKVTVTLFE